MANNNTSMKGFDKEIGYKSNCYKNTINSECAARGISIAHFTGVPKGFIKRSPENVFIKDSSASQKVLREWYEKGKYSEYKCSICGIGPEWNGKPLTLTLDHINGINNDDRLENLRWICPNCDRQLDTFGSKNPNRKQWINHKEKEQNYCIDCGTQIYYGSTRCVKCQGKATRKLDRPNKEELKKLLYDNKGNFTQIGKMFGIADNSVRKWCKSYNLSTHSSDYK